MGSARRIGVGVLAPLLVALAVACGASDTVSDTDGVTTSEATTATTTAATTSQRCPAPGEAVSLPLIVDFTSCAPLEAGEDPDRSSTVVEGAYQVDLSGEAWFTWIDFEESQQTVTVAADVTLPSASASVLPGSFTIICMGPRPSIASVRFGVMRSEERALAVVERDDGEGADGQYLAEEPVDPALLEGTVRVGFTCRATDPGVEVAGTVDDTVVAAASFADGTGYTPFESIGIRFDHSGSEGVDRFVVDDLSITGTA